MYIIFLIKTVHEKRQTEELLKGLTINFFFSDKGEDAMQLSI